MIIEFKDGSIVRLSDGWKRSEDGNTISKSNSINYPVDKTENNKIIDIDVFGKII